MKCQVYKVTSKHWATTKTGFAIQSERVSVLFSKDPKGTYCRAFTFSVFAIWIQFHICVFIPIKL